MGRKRQSDISENEERAPDFSLSSPSKKSKGEPARRNQRSLNQSNGKDADDDIDIDLRMVRVASWSDESQAVTTSEITLSESYDNSVFSALAAYSQGQGNLDKVNEHVVRQIRQHVVDFATRPVPPSLLHQEEKEIPALRSHGKNNSNRRSKREKLSNGNGTTDSISMNTSTRSIWSKYCHHIYIQHHEAVGEFGDCHKRAFVLDSDNETSPVHTHGKEIYRKYMLNQETPGSLLEVAFASMRYDLNAIVVQYLEKLNKFQVYNINPHLKNKIYLLNTEDIRGEGKWRNLEIDVENPSSFRHVGVYAKNDEGKGVNKRGSLLELHQTEKSSAPTMLNEVVKCDSVFFTRLLSGNATIDELSFHTENPEFHANNYALTSSVCSSRHLKNVHETYYELEQIFKGGLIESDSVFPFQSVENLTNIQDWSCKSNTNRSKMETVHENYGHRRVEQNAGMLNLLLDVPTVDEDIGKFQVQLDNQMSNYLDDSILRNNQKHSNYHDKNYYNYCGNNNNDDDQNHCGDGQLCCGNEALNLHFTKVKNNPLVETAVIARADFGNPQILIRLSPDAKLTYESETKMYLMTLHSTSICLQYFDFQRHQWQPSELKSSHFTISSNICFRLHNTSQEKIYIRCSWFSKTPACHSNLLHVEHQTDLKTSSQ